MDVDPRVNRATACPALSFNTHVLKTLEIPKEQNYVKSETLCLAQALPFFPSVFAFCF